MRTWSRPALALVAVCVLAACAFRRLRHDTAEMASQAVLAGEVRVPGFDGRAPLVVAAGKLPEDGGSLLQVFGSHVLREPDAFAIRVPPGKYVVGAYVDENRDGHWNLGERGTVSRVLRVAAGKRIGGLRLSIGQTGGRPPDLDEYRALEAFELARGDVVPLDDPRFGEAPARRGMWEPLAAARDLRPGVYMLRPYDPNKTPVLFVHGMMGFPQQFAALIADLDRRRFQPWVALYPSGLAFDGVANVLHLLMNEIEARYAPKRICVVAHSMGGLVARKFVGIHEKKTPDHPIRALVTLASPVGGMPSAGMGVKMAPAVVPSWYDIAPGSEFLATLYRPPLPDEVEYHLLFAYDGKGADDGTVPIPRQLRDEAQGEATVVRGYEATHVGILRSKAAAAQVRRALDRCRGDRPTPGPVAPRPLAPGVRR